MKICFPTQGNQGLSEEVFNHFGSAGFFCVYDTDSDKVEVLKNSNLGHSHGNCQPVQAIAGLEIDAIVTAGMGRRAISILNHHNIKVFSFSGGTVESAVKELKSGGLKEMDASDGCGHHGCGS